MDELLFPPGSVPVSVAAKVFGKDANWVRTGIIAGWLPKRNCMRKPDTYGKENVNNGSKK